METFYDREHAKLSALYEKLQDRRIAWENDLARPEQLPSDDENWSIYLYLAGRGAGKTRTAAEWLAWEATTHNNTRWAIVAPTFGDVRDVCAEGESGIINILRDYGSLADYNRSQGAITLTNGSKIKLFSADEPDRLRGPQHHGAWCDELAAWRYPDTWDQLQFGMRLGDHPRTVITTTPRPVSLIRNLVNRTDGSVKVVRGSTFDNAKNLAPQALLELQARYAGTRMGRQELYGELLNESDSALWTRALIEESRIKPEDAPPYFRVVVAIDPAVTSGESSDETGIVVAGATPDGHYYILEDATMRGTPEAWARKAVEMFRKWKCDRVIGEANNGGDMIEALLRQVDASIPYRKVTATRGKRVRAEPVSALSEQLRLHFVGNDFAQLEDQLVTWEPDSDKSPDRMDAMVWAVSDLMGGSVAMRSLAAMADFCPSCRLPLVRGTRLCPRCNTAITPQ